ncbi:replication initiation protein [Candidatus Enterovibrio escicola]|uniref:replication initiation protein n=1 Tax=Candidatus Enterovibrio escicola TaxID=1927127 RepID=UPI001237FDE3|nr:replication initiation protein [Candidatus Enterovibrio escacola]
MEISALPRKIYHRNDIRPALIDMTLPSKRLIYMCLAKIKRKSTIDNVILKFDSNQPFEITVGDYAQLCDIDYSAAYRQMVEGVKELRGYVLETDNSLVKSKNKLLPEDWIEPFTIADKGTGYSKGKGSVTIKFAEEMEYLVAGLESGFTGQFLLSALRLPTGNSGKLYLILREWISSGHRNEKILLVNDLKYELGVSDMYEEFKDFNKIFFKRSAKTVIDRTEFLDIKLEIIKRRARKAHLIKISYTYNEN